MNLRRNSIKCLYYDGTGLVIIAKRLERSLFCRINPRHEGDLELTAAEFGLFFEGADLEKRFIESPSEIKKSFFKNPLLQSPLTSVTVSSTSDGTSQLKKQQKSPGNTEQTGPHREDRPH